MTSESNMTTEENIELQIVEPSVEEPVTYDDTGDDTGDDAVSGTPVSTEAGEGEGQGEETEPEIIYCGWMAEDLSVTGETPMGYVLDDGSGFAPEDSDLPDPAERMNTDYGLDTWRVFTREYDHLFDFPGKAAVSDGDTSAGPPETAIDVVTGDPDAADPDVVNAVASLMQADSGFFAFFCALAEWGDVPQAEDASVDEGIFA
jgi:hypothetical protein